MKNETLINKLEKDNIKLKGLVYDVNSLYPSVMRTKLLPYGTPKYFEGCYNSIADFIKKDYPLYIQRIRVKRFEIKKNKMPNVQIRESENFNSTDYQTSNIYYDVDLKEFKHEECVFTFTNIQLKRFLDTYNTPLGVEYIDGYLFKGSYGIFDNYIDTFMKLKEVGKGAKRATAKLCLNSLYGKFGTNPQREERIVQFFDGVFSTTNRDEEGNLLEYLSESIYLPIASFITSYARDVLINAVNSVFDRFLYCDTDSIHILGYEVPNIAIHEKDLGYWKFEGKFINAKYIGAKRYAELIENKNELEVELKLVKHLDNKDKMLGTSKMTINIPKDMETSKNIYIDKTIKNEDSTFNIEKLQVSPTMMYLYTSGKVEGIGDIQGMYNLKIISDSGELYKENIALAGMGYEDGYKQTIVPSVYYDKSKKLKLKAEGVLIDAHKNITVSLNDNYPKVIDYHGIKVTINKVKYEKNRLIVEVLNNENIDYMGTSYIGTDSPMEGYFQKEVHGMKFDIEKKYNYDLDLGLMLKHKLPIDIEIKNKLTNK